MTKRINPMIENLHEEDPDAARHLARSFGYAAEEEEYDDSGIVHLRDGRVRLSCIHATRPSAATSTRSPSGGVRETPPRRR